MIQLLKDDGRVIKRARNDREFYLCDVWKSYEIGWGYRPRYAQVGPQSKIEAWDFIQRNCT